MKRAKDNLGIQKPTVLGVRPGGREGENKKVETFRIDYLIRTPKVEKLSLQPISFWLSGSHRLLPFKRLFCNRFFLLYTLGGGQLWRGGGGRLLRSRPLLELHGRVCSGALLRPIGWTCGL